MIVKEGLPITRYTTLKLSVAIRVTVIGTKVLAIMSAADLMDTNIKSGA
ncbi:hypothetical protein ES705_03549 [subsurface metagenome]